MKLREKFEPFTYFCDGNNSMERQYQREDNAVECEKVADEFAIGFAEWLQTHSADKWMTMWNGEWIGTKGLLEMYKKEKGL